jgi:hypothetical protein
MRRADFLKFFGLLGGAVPFVHGVPFKDLYQRGPEPEKEYPPGFIGRLLRAADEYETAHGEYPVYFSASRETMQEVLGEWVRSELTSGSPVDGYHSYKVHDIEWCSDPLLEPGEFLLSMERPTCKRCHGRGEIAGVQWPTNAVAFEEDDYLPSIRPRYVSMPCPECSGQGKLFGGQPRYWLTRDQVDELWSGSDSE